MNYSAVAASVKGGQPECPKYAQHVMFCYVTWVTLLLQYYQHAPAPLIAPRPATRAQRPRESSRQRPRLAPRHAPTTPAPPPPFARRLTHGQVVPLGTRSPQLPLLHGQTFGVPIRVAHHCAKSRLCSHRVAGHSPGVGHLLSQRRIVGPVHCPRRGSSCRGESKSCTYDDSIL